jgi:hypothetical protein
VQTTVYRLHSLLQVLRNYKYKMGKNDYCCAPTCDHRRSNGAKCSFYVLPKGPQWLRDAWLQRIFDTGLTWTPTSNSRLCGCHFKVPEETRSRLPERKSRLPTIFAGNLDFRSVGPLVPASSSTASSTETMEAETETPADNVQVLYCTCTLD